MPKPPIPSSLLFPFPKDTLLPIPVPETKGPPIGAPGGPLRPGAPSVPKGYAFALSLNNGIIGKLLFGYIGVINEPGFII